MVLKYYNGHEATVEKKVCSSMNAKFWNRGAGGGVNCLALIYPSWIKAMYPPPPNALNMGKAIQGVQANNVLLRFD